MDNRTWLLWSAVTVLLGYTLLAFADNAPSYALSLALIFGGVLAGMVGLIRAARAQ